MNLVLGYWAAAAGIGLILALLEFLQDLCFGPGPVSTGSVLPPAKIVSWKYA